MNAFKIPRTMLGYPEFSLVFLCLKSQSVLRSLQRHQSSIFIHSMFSQHMLSQTTVRMRSPMHAGWTNRTNGSNMFGCLNCTQTTCQISVRVIDLKWGDHYKQIYLRHPQSCTHVMVSHRSLLISCQASSHHTKVDKKGMIKIWTAMYDMINLFHILLSP